MWTTSRDLFKDRAWMEFSENFGLGFFHGSIPYGGSNYKVN
jgi:hypothetical protein